MDLVLSVNTAYLACIVIVLLFVIYKLSVNPKTWLLPLHHFVWSQTHCGLQAALFSSQDSFWSLADVFFWTERLLWDLRYMTPALSLVWNHRSCMIQFLQQKQTGQAKQLLGASIDQFPQRVPYIRDNGSRVLGGCSSADDGSRVMTFGVIRPCSHIGQKRRNNGLLLKWILPFWWVVFSKLSSF